ncbi:MAG: hypothetical protein ACYCUV_04885, partial [Phycisphaerae bacterium]
MHRLPPPGFYAFYNLLKRFGPLNLRKANPKVFRDFIIRVNHLSVHDVEGHACQAVLKLVRFNQPVGLFDDALEIRVATNYGEPVGQLQEKADLFLVGKGQCKNNFVFSWA